MNNLEKYIKVFFKFCPIYLLHTPFRVLATYFPPNFHLYWFMPLLGLFHYIKARSLLKLTLPFALLFTLAILYSALLWEFDGIKRGLFVLLMLGFTHYLVSNYDREELIQTVKSCLGVFIIIFFIQAAVFQQFAFKGLFPILEGPLGFPNHSGMITAILGLILFLEKKYKIFALALILTFFTWSRTALFIIMGGALFLCGQRILSERKKKYLCILLFLILLFNPLLVLLSSKILSQAGQTFLNEISSGRYFINLTFIKVFKVHWWGVGFDFSHKVIQNYIPSIDVLVDRHLTGLNEITPIPFVDLDPHNTWLRILVELGIWGYALFAFFMANLFREGMKQKRYDLVIGLFLVNLGYLTMDGLLDFGFYFYLAYYLYNLSDLSWYQFFPRKNHV